MSGKFLSDLYCKRLPDGKSQLTKALIFESGIANMVISVPRGFVTDFASVPRLPLAYWLFGGLADEPAVIHDFLYSRTLLPRATCDAIFREAMEARGLGAFHRNAMFWGVRLFGGSHYVAADKKIPSPKE